MNFGCNPIKQPDFLRQPGSFIWVDCTTQLKDFLILFSKFNTFSAINPHVTDWVGSLRADYLQL